MIQKHRIRLNSTESVNSVDKDNRVAVELKHSTKPYFFTNDIREEIDQFETFKQERDNCSKYRLITTIKPYCTNVLFNVVTEIVKNEGSSSLIIVTDEENNALNKNRDGAINYALGLQTDIRRNYMVQNTEYSSEKIGYVYHPGYDIFNNHLLRNNSFKIVNNNRGLNRDVFNTLEDFAREYDGTIIKFSKRVFQTDKENFTVEGNRNMHLYQLDDIMSVTDCINQKLIEENGWVGFVNKTTINAKDKNINTWYELDYNNIINNKENCDFIDMYPDRTLYSFNPKYNAYQHRLEYNWKTYLTYPCKNFYNHELIKDFSTALNAVLIQDATYVSGITGQDTILFKTYIKHNLLSGSTINLFYKSNSDNKYQVIENLVISGIGDLSKNDKDYFFYTTDTRILTETNIDKKGTIENYEFRFINIVNGYESEYYIRIFKKMPNLLKTENINENDLLDKNYFNNETYKLGFSNTIFNDDNTQITFTDGIEIDGLLDNRGRPLSEIYLTIIKNNKGNALWYNEDETTINKNYSDIEYSHCFSDVNYGFDLFCGKDNLTDKQRKTHAQYSDIKTMHSNTTIDEARLKVGYNMLSTDIRKYGWSEYYNDITIDTDNEEYFIGDIVEYNPTTATETTLSEGFFRFNTYLRDNPNVDKYYYSLSEIKSDDYDADGFEIETDGVIDSSELFHPEGYYYKAHYPIQLREWGELNQDSHFNLKIKSTTKTNIGNKLCIIVKTSLPHRLSASDILLICYDEEDKVIMTNPIYIFDELTFAIGDYIGFNEDTQEYEVIVTAEDIYSFLNEEHIKVSLRRYNDKIPFYASKTPHKNRYMWRTLNNVGNKNNVNLQEYPYANGYFYINQDINFYLKRQDPFGKIGLYYDGSDSKIPNDIFGNLTSPSEFEYKEENDITC